MEYCEHEFSACFREQERVFQLPPKQKALWHLDQDIEMLEDMKNGLNRSPHLGLWIVEGRDRVDRIIPRGSAEFKELTSDMDALYPLLKEFVTHAEHQLCLPAIESARAILLGCKAKLESWTDEEAAEKFSAIILKFPGV
jgi:hypothetical protein